MARGRRHRALLSLPAFLLAQGASCLDPDPAPDAGPDPATAKCCVACAAGEAPCGDACVAGDAECDEEPGCACAGAPAAGSACEAACSVEESCGFRATADCVLASCTPSGARLVDDGDDCLAAAADCAAAALCACPGGCAKLDECAGDEDPACEDTCTTLVGQEPVATFQENRCRIESSCDDLALCSQ